MNMNFFQLKHKIAPAYKIQLQNCNLDLNKPNDIPNHKSQTEEGSFPFKMQDLVNWTLPPPRNAFYFSKWWVDSILEQTKRVM